jgi:hypothetical protein
MLSNHYNEVNLNKITPAKMNPNSVVSSFPNPATIRRIEQLPQATHDISQFATGYTAQKIADELQGQEVLFNVANADDKVEGDDGLTEKGRILAAVEILRGQEEKVKVVGEEVKDEIGAINHNILKAALNRSRGAFKQFFAKVSAEDLQKEYNTYIAPREAAFDDVHSWENIGVSNINDPIRRRVVGLLDEVAQENAEKLQEEVMPGFDDNPALHGQDVSRAIVLSMLSNFVRGIYYKHQNPEKVYDLRKTAVETLDEVGEDRWGAKTMTFFKKKFFGR